MASLLRLLDPPSYGFEKDGKLIQPNRSQILKEFFSRINIFKSVKNWIPFTNWLAVGLLTVVFFIFIFKFFTWPLFFIGLLYAMFFLGTHGTIYLHRYSTHRAFQFKNKFFLFLVRNLSIKILPEEVYVVSHHVHHQASEKPGDPYNVNGGWLYCFLADVNHQNVARDLSSSDYQQLTKLLNHTGVKPNSYPNYLKYASIAQPLRTYFHFAANWAFWYAVFYWIGGHSLATAIFGMSATWAVGVRTFNYDGHGGGRDKRQDGIDFNRDDLSINQMWPGIIASEWHNNHHLYPTGARSGFLPYQIDVAWYFIRFLSSVGAVKSYKDYHKEFYRDYYRPYLMTTIDSSKKLKTT